MPNEFRRKTGTEQACLFYEFSMNGDQFFCREAYENGDALLAHMGNIAGLLAIIMKTVREQDLELDRKELEKLRHP